MDHKFHHRQTVHREMHMNCVVEAILTTLLLLSRVWARPSDVVCDGGRKEGAKWFDGCQWCVCQRSGPMCSSSECSHLVALVPPCQKVDSRWWDGCYHCRCYLHGIECNATKSCNMLMRSERFGVDFLLHDGCLNPQDGRCVCGVDGVPSCTAEVIDRNAHPAKTIGLNLVFPSSSSLIVPNIVYYGGAFNKHISSRRQPVYYADSSYYEDDGQMKRTHEQQRWRRSLERHHAKNSKRHLHDFDNSLDNMSHGHNRAVKSHLFLSQDARNPRHYFPNAENGRLSSRSRHTHSSETQYARDLTTDIDDNHIYHKNKRRDCPYANNFHCLYGLSSKQSDIQGGYNKLPIQEKKEIMKSGRREGVHRSQGFRGSSSEQSEELLEGIQVNDQPAGSDKVKNASLSLLIASDNRCRWGVRWYGGSLRCYCDVDNSITCGDPSFVASRIDGFRLELASCEEGHIWEDVDSCRVCECQISGVALCRRSSSCPLPFLIKPLPMDSDDDNQLNGNGESLTGQVDAFTGREELTWDKNKTNTKLTLGEDSGEDTKDENVSENILIDTDSSKNDLSDKSKNTNSKFPKLEESDDGKMPKTHETSGNHGNSNIGNGLLDILVGATGHATVIVNGQEDPDNNSVDVSEENDIDYTDSNNKNDFKRTTQEVSRECKPKSRWMDGCKRCECDQDGRKHCDDSRCPKAMSVTEEMINAPSDIVNSGHSRPVQRPPSEFVLARTGPVNLSPPFMKPNPCGRKSLGEKYWDLCNLCFCTSQGPKCTAKNCL